MRRDILAGKTLDIYHGWLALALLDSMDQANPFASVQFGQQLNRLFVAAVKSLLYIV